MFDEPISGQDLARQFNPQDSGPEALVRNLNAAFLLGLTGNKRSANAREYIATTQSQTGVAKLARFFQRGFDLLEDELARATSQDASLERRIAHASKTLENPRRIRL